MKITARTKICMVIGDPVNQSLSPVMHNAGFKSIGIEDQFIFVAARVKREDINQIPKIMKVLDIRGISCTIPHKVEIIKCLEQNDIDPIAKRIGAVNTLVNEEGKIKGYNTDWLGVVGPLEKLTKLNGKKVAIIGAGGLARATAFGLFSRKARFTIYNRTNEKAKRLAREFGGKGKSLDATEEVKDADIIINTTPIGMHPNIDETPIPKELISKHQIVFDAVYVPQETKLLKEAKEQGAKTITGLEMLLHQGMVQFELFTGRKAPEETMRHALINCN